MDFVDVLITLVIFAIFIGSEVLKIKKKAASTASQKIHNEVDLEEDLRVSREGLFQGKRKVEK